MPDLHPPLRPSQPAAGRELQAERTRCADLAGLAARSYRVPRAGSSSVAGGRRASRCAKAPGALLEHRADQR